MIGGGSNTTSFKKTCRGDSSAVRKQLLTFWATPLESRQLRIFDAFLHSDLLPVPLSAFKSAHRAGHQRRAHATQPSLCVVFHGQRRNFHRLVHHLGQLDLTVDNAGSKAYRSTFFRFSYLSDGSKALPQQPSRRSAQEAASARVSS